MTKRFIDCALTIDQEKAMCAEYGPNCRQEQLAKKYGVSQGTVQRIFKWYGIKCSRKLYQYNEHFFQTIETEAHAYFLGLLTADGYIETGPKRYVVQLNQTDRELVEMFRVAIEGNQPIYEIDMSKWRGKTSYMIAVGSKIMTQDLVALGLHRKKSKTVTWCQEVPEHLIHHYMRGLFDGDGSIGSYKHGLQFSFSGTFDIVKNFQDRLVRYCYLPTSQIGFATGHYVLQYGKKWIAKIGGFLYRDASIFLHRKYDIFPEGDWQPFSIGDSFKERDFSF